MMSYPFELIMSILGSCQYWDRSCLNRLSGVPLSSAVKFDVADLRCLAAWSLVAPACVPPTLSFTVNSGDFQPFTSFDSSGKLGATSVDVVSGEKDDPADTRATSRSFDLKPPIAFSTQSPPLFEASRVVRGNAVVTVEMRSSLPLRGTTRIGLGHRPRKARAPVSYGVNT